MTAVLHSRGVVYVLDSGESTQLDCVFAMRDFSHFDNPVVWIKTQRHECSLVNVLATIEPPFLATGRFSSAFQLLQRPTTYRMSLAIASQYSLHRVTVA